MKHLLRADFYRLFHSKFFYILLAVAFGMSLLSFFLYLSIVAFAGQLIVGGQTVLDGSFTITLQDLQTFSFDGTVGYCAAIAAAIFICGDYSGGGIRNKILTGCGRMKIYFSHLIVMAAASVCFYLAGQFVVFAIGGFAFGWGDASVYDVLLRFVTGLFLSAANGAIFSAIAMLCERLPIALILSIVILFAVPIVFSLLVVAQNYIGGEAVKRAVQVFGWLTPMAQSSLILSGSRDFLAMCGFSCAWLVLSFFVFLLPFKKRDIK